MVAAVASPAASSLPGVDGYLKLLAEAGLALAEAEDAAGDGEIGLADEALDRADAALAALREAWPGMASGERRVVGRAAAPLSARLDRTRARLPARRALSEGTPERDPDEEVDPARAA
jgi:hypothetical protein